jgi:superfamily I DNA/RNA helicase/mRNA-degrading endonuclease RelE of RelBE toxin-antitoxin system
MTEIGVSADFFPAYAALPRKAQRKVETFLQKFRQDPKQPSIHYEPLGSTEDPRLRSVRIGDDYRAIVRAPEGGELFLLLWVDHHDEAYRWARSKHIGVHPVTGSMQIYDVEAAVEAIRQDSAGVVPIAIARPGERESDQKAKSGLFQAFDDDALFIGGVPRPLLPAVRAVESEEDLDRLLPHVPQEAADLLSGLAAGYAYDEVLSQILDDSRQSATLAAPDHVAAVEPTTEVVKSPSTLPPTLVDVSDESAALRRENSRRQFRLLDGSFDLDTALAYPLDLWRVYLHPQQKRLVTARTKGPMRVTGAAGTGKTVTAMHRAAYLVRDVWRGPDDRLLLTTYTVNLAADIRHLLKKLLEPEDLVRIEVTNLDAWANRFLAECGKPMRLATETDRRQAWDRAMALWEVPGYARSFFDAEWRDVILAQDIQDVDTYVHAIRIGRGVSVGRAERRQVWDVFTEYRDQLATQGIVEAEEILRLARRELESQGKPPRYRSVIVDETQDISPEGLKLLRAIAGPERPDDMFLVGDAHQRIYGRLTPLGQSGIHVRGRRSRTLRVNYRTTAAISRWSLGVLGQQDYDDLDTGKVSRKGQVSLRKGEAPTVRIFQSRADEAEYVATEVAALVSGGVPPESICVVGRTRDLVAEQFLPLIEQRGQSTVVLGKELVETPGIRLATMHRVKGLEFPIMFVVGVDRDHLPLVLNRDGTEDPVLQRQHEQRERCLLYVAASRARDRLFVTGTGEPSSFLVELAATESSRHQSSQVRKVADSNIEEPKTDHATQGTQKSSRTRPKAGATVDDWNALASWLPADFADVRVREAMLPVRLLNYCERNNIPTLGHLVARTREELIAADNVGRTTVSAGELAIREFVGSREALGRRWEEGLVASWRSAMGDLGTVERLVLTQRCALFGPQVTLEEVGELTGVTRERVRQIESGAIEEMSHGGAWTAFLTGRFEAAVGSTGAARLDELVNNPWWVRVNEVPAALQYLCEKILDGRWDVVTVGEEHWLARVDKKVVEKAQRELQRFLKQVKLSAPLTAFDQVRRSVTKKVGPALSDALWREIEDSLEIEQQDGQDPMVLNAAGTKTRRLLAILRASTTPMRVADITDQMGRLSQMPDEVLFFGGGRIGLAQHFPDFESWVAQLAPLVLNVIREQGPDRQWLDSELLAEIADEVVLPTWLDHWHLTAALRQSKELQYLGRGRFALPGAIEEGARIELKDRMVELVRANGEPMEERLLLARLKEKIDFRDSTAKLATARPPFVKMDEERIGLMERDLPGGMEAIEEVCEHLEALLARRSRGLPLDDVCVETSRLTQIHAKWSREMTLSVLRADARFRISRWGAVGLSEWESVRFPSRTDVLRRCLEARDGRVTVEAAMDQIEAVYGQRPDRATLWGPVQQLGAKIVGEWVVAETGTNTR